MLIFNGFPTVLWNKQEMEVDFTISVSEDYNVVYEKKLHSNFDEIELFKIASEVHTLYAMNKEKDNQIFGSNFIEFLIWMDKKYTYQNQFIRYYIGAIANMSCKIDMLQFFIKNSGLVKEYELEDLINQLWEIDLKNFYHNDAFFLLKEFCIMYKLNYKEKILCLLEKILSTKTLKMVEDNFDMIFDDLEQIIYFAINENNVQELEYNHMCVLKNIIDSIMDKND